MPSDFYELLGLCRFHPKRDEMLQMVRQTNRALHGYQHHPQKSILHRARELQLLLAEAEHVLSRDDSWHVFEEQLAKEGGYHDKEIKTWLIPSPEELAAQSAQQQQQIVTAPRPVGAPPGGPQRGTSNQREPATTNNGQRP